MKSRGDYHDVDYNCQDNRHNESRGNDYRDVDYNSQDNCHNESHGDDYHDVDYNSQDLFTIAWYRLTDPLRATITSRSRTTLGLRGTD